MAAHQSPRSNNQERGATSAALRKSAAIGADPEDMVLLREKLNQIAVGRRCVGDNQVDHMDDSDGDDDYASGARRRRPAPGSGHFRVFLPGGERPSTPPSSPQPRDVLRKHLRMKSHAPCHAPRRSLSSEDNNSDTASDEPLDGMCVDSIEISPLPESTDHGHALPTHPTVRLSVPEHLRVRTSSYSILTKCPEGFRKRKSVHMDDKDLVIDGHSVVAPLKKSSSHVNVLSAAASMLSATSPVEAADQEMEEDDGSDPSQCSPDDVSSCS